MIELMIYDNRIFWYSDDKMHNKYGPAFIWSSGSKSWWINGTRHRLDGPAVVQLDGREEWWVDNVKYHSGLEYLVAVEEFNTNKETYGNCIVYN